MKNTITLIVTMLAVKVSVAQYNHMQIISDRPYKTALPFTVNSGQMQMQNGLNYGGFIFTDDEGDEYRGNDLLVNSFIRLGIVKGLEINTLVEYSNLKRQVNKGDINVLGGISAIDVGFRYQVVDSRNSSWVPSFALQTTVKMNKYAGDLGINYFAPEIILISSKNLGENIALNTNLGLDWNGINPSAQAKYACNIVYAPAASVFLFVENYGVIQDQQIDTRFQIGAGFLPLKNLQIDANASYGRNDGKQDYNLGFGISYRLFK